MGYDTRYIKTFWHIFWFGSIHLLSLQKQTVEHRQVISRALARIYQTLGRYVGLTVQNQHFGLALKHSGRFVGGLGVRSGTFDLHKEITNFWVDLEFFQESGKG